MDQDNNDQNNVGSFFAGSLAIKNLHIVITLFQ